MHESDLINCETSAGRPIIRISNIEENSKNKNSENQKNKDHCDKWKRL